MAAEVGCRPAKAEETQASNVAHPQQTPCSASNSDATRMAQTANLDTSSSPGTDTDRSSAYQKTSSRACKAPTHSTKAQQENGPSDSGMPVPFLRRPSLAELAPKFFPAGSLSGTNLGYGVGQFNPYPQVSSRSTSPSPFMCAADSREKANTWRGSHDSPSWPSSSSSSAPCHGGVPLLSRNMTLCGTPNPLQGLLFLDGCDTKGRPVVVLNTQAIPSKASSRVKALEYALGELRPFVCRDYVLVVVNLAVGRKVGGVNSIWALKVYRKLGKPFRKNVKHIVLVQPSALAKAVIAIMQPFVSKKAGDKIKKVECLEDIGRATNGEVQLSSLGQRFLETLQRFTASSFTSAIAATIATAKSSASSGFPSTTASFTSAIAATTKSSCMPSSSMPSTSIYPNSSISSSFSGTVYGHTSSTAAAAPAVAAAAAAVAIAKAAAAGGGRGGSSDGGGRVPLSTGGSGLGNESFGGRGGVGAASAAVAAAAAAAAAVA